MKKSFVLIAILAVLAAVSACGNSSEKGRTLARIDGVAFTEGDLDLRLSVNDDARREEILRDTAARKREFENILRGRLYALAGRNSAYGKSAVQKRRLAMVNQRIVTQYYFENHLRNNGGFTRAEIEARYNANPGRYSDSGTKALPLAKVYSKVVDDLIISKANLDSFYQANLASYREPAWVEASVIRTADSAKALIALKALKGGMKFSDAAAKYSVHASKSNGGKVGRVIAGEDSPDFGPGVSLDDVFFNEKTRVAPGAYSNVFSWNNGFVIAGVDAYHPPRTPALEEVRARVKEDYVRSRRESDMTPVIEALKAQHNVRLIPLEREPSDKEVQAYYAAHIDEYTSPETFELYHVEAKDSASLAKALAGVSTLDQFKALAAKASDNNLTQAQGGLLGWVKRDFVLPYGVGMMPSLFPLLDETSSGKIGEVLQNPATQKWHAFWLSGKAAAKPKSLDRVHDVVVRDLKANFIASVKPTDTLAVIGTGNKALREEDVLFLRQEIPENMQERYTRESLVNYLLVWQVAADEAMSRGLDKERQLRAMLLQSEDSYWASIYRDSILPATWEQSPAALEKTFKANLSLFVRDSSASRKLKDYTHDVAALMMLTPQDFDLEYRTFPERYMRDTVAVPFAEARPAIFDALKQAAYVRLENAILETLKKRFKVTIEDPALKEPSLEPTAVTYKKAQDLHYDRKVDVATALYEKLRERYPQRAGLQDSVSFGLAQIYLEQERFAQALAEYRRVHYLYPNSPN
ncbi:MAG TPA: peptidyl-prolyl cis-trans isomerase, partial [Fibrobacteria bacterium]|nr:peptidyl-prolyl cis-trans isomerase [Fibrobacteria bacterium]